MTIYVPGVAETDPKKQNRSLQQLGTATSTNTTSIATNAADIATNTTNIATNTTNIATNTTNIATNTASIAAHEAAWATFTPTLTATAGTYTTASASMRYLVMGKTVIFSGAVTITTVGTGTTPIITLPIAARAAGPAPGSGREIALTGKSFAMHLINTTQLLLTNYDNTSPAASGANLTFSGIYEAA